jgi:hypothetical protein
VKRTAKIVVQVNLKRFNRGIIASDYRMRMEYLSKSTIPTFYFAASFYGFSP